MFWRWLILCSLMLLAVGTWAEGQRLIQKRQELIDDALDRINRSDRLRSLVQVFDQKIESMNEAVNGYDKWRCWALDQAMAIDPKTMSVEHIGQWIGEFRLLE